MANPSPGPPDGSAAWHSLMRDRSLQFQFPALPPAQPPPDWLVNLRKFLDAHAAWFHYGGWVLLAALAAAVLFGLVRLVMHRGWIKAENAIARTVPALWQPSPERARLLLADADALAAQGRFEDAAHLLLLVAVQEIGERRPGLVRPALTAREIARLPALSPRARDVFGVIAAVVERCLFGARTLGQDEFAAIRAAFEQFTIAQTWQAAA